MDTEKMGSAAKAAERILGVADTNTKNNALEAMASALESDADKIISANETDLANGRKNGMKESLLDRLRLTRERIAGMADGIRQVAALSDPVGEIIEGSVRPNGMKIRRVRVPLGVVGIIFESRPNVTSDAAALCLKSGNACILRGGKEAINSNMAIADTLRQAVVSAGLPADCIQLVSDTSRESAMLETRVQSLGWEDLLEKEMATHSSILAWKILWTEESGGLQSMGWQGSYTI